MGSLAYRSAPMKKDTTILGSAQITLYFSTEQKDTDFMVVMHDISPSGETLYLQRSFLRASHRMVDPTKSSSHWVYHPHEKIEELIAGQVYAIRMSMPEVGHVLRRGHSLELVILAPSVTPGPDWGPLPLALPGINTIYHSLQHPSSVLIPVIPGLKARAPALKCGVLGQELFQPCRPDTPESLSAARMR
jgi:predicted acyl esterase